MPNQFLGFPVSRAKFAEVSGRTAGASLPFDDFYYSTFFDSLDGLEQTIVGGAGISLYLTAVTLMVTSALNDSARLRKKPVYPIVPLTWGKDRTVRFRCNIGANTDNTTEFWLSSGDIVSGRGVGFYFNAGKLYARTKGDSGTTDVEIQDFGAGPYTFRETLKIIFTAAVDVKFYIDGVLKTTITTNLPSGTSNADRILFLQITNNTGTGQGSVDFSYFDIYQKA